MTASQPNPKAPRSSALHHPTRPLRLWQEHNHDQGETRIELLPLMDIIFCILTFFILAAVGLSRQQAISMDLPKASTGQPQMREMLVVSLDDMGQLYVEKQPVTENQLFDALKNYRQYNPNGLMVLHASRNASYNDVVQLLDVLRQVGGDRVALATLPGEGQGNSTIPSFGNPASSFPSSLGTGTSNPGNPYGTSLPNTGTIPGTTIPGTRMPNTGTIPGSSGTLPGMGTFPNSSGRNFPTNPGMTSPLGTTTPGTIPNTGLSNGLNSTIPNAPTTSTGITPSNPSSNQSVPDRLPRR